MAKHQYSVSWTHHLVVLCIFLLTTSIFSASSQNLSSPSVNSRKNADPSPLATPKAPETTTNTTTGATKSVSSSATTEPSITADQCQRVSRLFVRYGFPVDGISPKPIPGTSLTVCSSSYTCCTVKTEKRLYRDASHKVSSTFRSMLRNPIKVLDRHQRDLKKTLHQLLKESHVQLHKQFIKIYGFHYNSNRALFVAFFEKLQAYARGEEGNLSKLVYDFFKKVGERMFLMLDAKERVGKTLGEKEEKKHVNCLKRQFNFKKAFGRHKKNLAIDLLRSLGAARTLIQALDIQREVLTRVMNTFILEPECMNALTRVSHCSQCAGFTTARPCPTFCQNVVRGCFAQIYKIAPEWTKLSDDILELLRMINGRNSLQQMLESSLSLKISGSIITFTQYFSKTKQMVYSKCRKPYRIRRAVDSHKLLKRSRRAVDYNAKVQETISTRWLQNFMMDLQNKVLKRQRNLWKTITSKFCEKNIFNQAIETENCWNGTARGAYNGALAPATFAGQLKNPEVAVDVSRAQEYIRRVLGLLREVRQRVKDAHEMKEVSMVVFDRTEPKPVPKISRPFLMKPVDNAISGSGSGSMVDRGTGFIPKKLAVLDLKQEGSGANTDDEDSKIPDTKDLVSGDKPIDSRSRSVPKVRTIEPDKPSQTKKDRKKKKKQQQPPPVFEGSGEKSANKGGETVDSEDGSGMSPKLVAPVTIRPTWESRPNKVEKPEERPIQPEKAENKPKETQLPERPRQNNRQPKLEESRKNNIDRGPIYENRERLPRIRQPMPKSPIDDIESDLDGSGSIDGSGSFSGDRGYQGIYPPAKPADPVEKVYENNVDPATYPRNVWLPQGHNSVGREDRYDSQSDRFYQRRNTDCRNPPCKASSLVVSNHLLLLVLTVMIYFV